MLYILLLLAIILIYIYIVLLPISTAVVVIAAKISVGTVSCFYEVSCELAFVSLNFFIPFKFIHTIHYFALILYLTITIWVLSNGGMKARGIDRITDVIRAML